MIMLFSSIKNALILTERQDKQNIKDMFMNIFLVKILLF